MIPEEFSYHENDPTLESWLESHFGKEVFTPDQNRLKKYFSSFKEKFNNANVPIITIAGTNGKGEVALLLESLFLENGFQPLLWTSPHILTVRERFSFSGILVENSRLLNLFQSLGKSELSYYEFLFYCFCHLSLEEVEKLPKPILIFEVGLGGRLDATNFFDADLAVLTSIGRDHMELLGPTLSDVLREKLGVTRANKPLVCAIQQKYLIKLTKEFCTENFVNLQQIDNGDLLSFKEVNRVTALTAFKTFLKSLDISAYSLSIPNKLWARPFEVTYKSCQFILIGSHNLDGLRHLAKWVNNSDQVVDEACNRFDELWIGLSRKPGKDLDQCLSLIHKSPCLGELISFAGFDHPRATPLKAIKESWSKLDQGRKVRFEESWRTYLQNLSSEQRVLVCGSNYFIGEILKSSDLKLYL